LGKRLDGKAREAKGFLGTSTREDLLSRRHQRKKVHLRKRKKRQNWEVEQAPGGPVKPLGGGISTSGHANSDRLSAGEKKTRSS